jgi:hypothetical protein
MPCRRQPRLEICGGSLLAAGPTPVCTESIGRDHWPLEAGISPNRQ